MERSHRDSAIGHSKSLELASRLRLPSVQGANPVFSLSPAAAVLPHSNGCCFSMPESSHFIQRRYSA